MVLMALFSVAAATDYAAAVDTDQQQDKGTQQLLDTPWQVQALAQIMPDPILQHVDQRVAYPATNV